MLRGFVDIPCSGAWYLVAMTAPWWCHGFRASTIIGESANSGHGGSRSRDQIPGRQWCISQRNAGIAAILAVQSGDGTMRAYITATGISLGLVSLWAALAQLIA